MSMLTVRGLCAGYGQVEVLCDVDLDVERNQIVALIGPNSAGKSTLLRALSGMVKPTSGTAQFQGRELTTAGIEDIAALGIAHVPEGRRLFPALSVRDNLLLGGWCNRNTDIGPVLDLFPRLAERLSQPVGSMSGGEQQMCAIGRGLMARPGLLMIDELSLGLAPALVDEIMAILPDVAAAGTGILLVEQDVDAALSTAEHGYVLESGRIVLHGPSGRLLADPEVRRAYLGVA
jgi:branched-chain amino acid transport system ATP-binding protein